MKKLILSFFSILLVNTFFGQATLYRSYSYFGNSGLEEVHQVLGNKTIFFGYHAISGPDIGVIIQKNDLDGNPIWKKIVQGLDDISNVEMYNGNLIMVGQRAVFNNSVTTANVCIASIDTSNGNLNYFKAHAMPTYSAIALLCTKLLANGDILVGGSCGASSVGYGYIGRFNASTGNLVYHESLLINGEACNVRSLEEYNNSSLFICGYYGNSTINYYAAKISNNATPVISTVRSFNDKTVNINKLNTNRLLIHSGGLMIKVDTNLVAVGNGSWTTNNFNTGFSTKSFYRNGKIYVTGAGGLKQMAIVDTLGAMTNTLAACFYTTGGSSQIVSGYLQTNGTNLFITHATGANSAPFYLLKTDMNGNTSCSTVGYFTCSTQSFSSAVLNGSLSSTTGTLGTLSPTIVTGTISTTFNCFTATGISENTVFSNGVSVRYKTDGYTINSSEVIRSLAVIDINGRDVKHFESEGMELNFSLNEEPKGIYIVTITSANGNVCRKKIIK
jgi:hypothetical protein